MASVKSISNKKLGRRPGGEDTRAKIVTAAQTQFAAEGYGHASLRQIGSLAEVDPALIIHYFGTKQRLFAEAMLPLFEGPKLLPAALEGSKNGIGLRLAELFVKMTSQPSAQKLMLGLFRSASSEERAAEMIRSFIQTGIIDRVEKFLPGPNKKLQANILGGQMVGIFITRYVLKVEPIANVTAEELIAYLAPRLQAHFE